MPTYLCHGFRWKRRSIRVYVVVQNLDDAAPEWIIRCGSARNLIESFYDLFDFLPECTMPPTRSSSAGPRSDSVPQSSDQVSISEGRDADDEDATSRHTTPSSRMRMTTRTRTRRRSRSRSSRSRSQNRAAGTLHGGQQQPVQPGHRDRDPAAHCRQASSSSHRRQGSGTMSSSGSDANPLPHPPKPSTAHHHHHQAPPSPPSSQPCRPSLSQVSDASAASDPILAQSWSPVKLLEEHDPANLDEVSRPYAYVADYVTRIDSSCSIVEEIQRYEARVRGSSGAPAITGPSSDELLNPKRDTAKLGKGAGWFEQLRDQLQRGEEIRWYVVVNGDEDRPWPAGEEPDSSSSAQPESRASATHHAQSAQQQSILEEQDRDLEIRREQLRRELGYEEGGVDRLLDRRPERRPKPPDVELPPQRAAASSSAQMDPVPPRTPKSPGRGALRRLFSRSKSSEEMPSQR